MTPSLSGRIASMFPGTLPSILFASDPTATTDLWPSDFFIATTDGSFRTIPFPLAKMSVLAVPRSIDKSVE